jgi:hypothetical protein
LQSGLNGAEVIGRAAFGGAFGQKNLNEFARFVKLQNAGFFEQKQKLKRRFKISLPESATLVPEPGRVTKTPISASARIASRTAGRLTPICRANSRSAGKRAFAPRSAHDFFNRSITSDSGDLGLEMAPFSEIGFIFAFSSQQSCWNWPDRMMF